MNIIKKLELYGFKSFYNRKEITFPSGLNVITGPNGSGKSNISEALCFVLGKASKKDLRAEKLSNFIYHGGKKLPEAKFAKVTVEIDNKERKMPINEDIIRISRKVDKDGRSIYRVNGKHETREYINNLLAHANLDPDGFNIILQGEIQKFVELSSEERRKIIEDISGISIYEEKKHKCMLEFEKVDEKIKEANIILAEKTKHMAELQKEKEQAEKSIEIQKLIRIKRASKIIKELEELNKGKEVIEKQLQMKENEITEHHDKRTKLIEEISKINSQIDNINKELREKGETEQIEISQQVEALRNNVNELKANIKSNENEIKRIQEREQGIYTNIRENESKIKALENEYEILKKNIEEMKVKLEEEREKFEKLNNIDKESLKLHNKKSEIENEILILNQEFSSNKQKVNELKQMEEMKVSLEKMKKELQEKLQQDSLLVVEISELKENHAKFLKELHNQEGKREVYLNMLERGVKEIIEAKNKGILKGIYGTVSSLGKVNEEYKLPLSVAAGNRINSIVVENEDIAKQCIEYLRTNKLGIATFLPLNKIKNQESEFNYNKNTPGIIAPAIELINYDPKFANVFNYVFGNTLIVKNIDTAKKVGINAIRMVTLDGDLIEKSGAMVGGHRKKENIEFGQDIDEVINKIKDKIAEVEESINELEPKRLKISEEIMQLRGRIYEIESRIKNINVDTNNIEKIEKEIKLKESELKQVNDEISNLPKKLDPSLLEKLQKIISEKEKELNDYYVNFKGKETEINLLEKDIEESEEVLKSLAKEKISFSKELEENIKLLKINEEKLTLKLEEEKKFHGKLKDLYEQRNELLEKVKNIEIEKAKLEEIINKLREHSQDFKLKIAEFNAKIESKKVAYEEYKDLEIKEVKESVQKLENDIIELQTRLTGFGMVNMKALDTFREIEKEYNNLKVKVDTLLSEKNEIIKAMNEVEKNKKDTFMEVFVQISENFSRIFAMLSKDGEAKLILENPEDPFSGGVDIIAKPHGKQNVPLIAMSGGEKTLTTLAFIFAIQEYLPAPFYIMDEVDAALDKENSEKLAELIKQYSSKSQFIVISHNDSLINVADNIFGVHMNNLGESQVVSLKLPAK